MRDDIILYNWVFKVYTVKLYELPLRITRERVQIDYLTFKNMVETLHMFNFYAMMLVNELCINQPLYRAEWLKSEQIG